MYVKPFVKHALRGQGKALLLRVGGSVAGDATLELSSLGAAAVDRALEESMQWFNPKGRQKV